MVIHQIDNGAQKRICSTSDIEKVADPGKSFTCRVFNRLLLGRKFISRKMFMCYYNGIKVTRAEWEEWLQSEKLIAYLNEDFAIHTIKLPY
jgi:hypothetical protein